MGQKIHPLSLRIQAGTRYFDHAWYSDYFFSKLISADISIVRYLNHFLKGIKLPSGRFSIYHLPKTTKLYSFFCYPKQTREFKSKMFNVSSGLFQSKIKKSKFSQSIQPKYFTKLSNRSALLDSALFNKLSTHQLTNSIHSYPLTSLKRFPPLNTLNCFTPFLIMGIYNLFQLNKYNVSIDQKSASSTLSPLVENPYLNTIKSFSGKSQHIDKLISLSKKDSSTKFNHNFIKHLLNSYKLSDLVLTKNSNAIKLKSEDLSASEVLFILRNFLTISKITKVPYNISKVTSNLLEMNTLVKNENNLKYNSSLERNLSRFLNSDISLIPFQTSWEWQDAGYFADEIVFLLERRVSFRQIKNKILKQFVFNPHVQGVRITCSGRVGGKSKKAQRARLDSIKYGQTSLHIFSSRIDFAARTAYTSLGSTGVKVWICYK